MTGVSKTDIELVRNSGLFDAGWYLETYPDVKAIGMDPVEHYLWLGARLGRKPSPNFEETAGVHANGAAAAPDLLLNLARSAKNGRGESSPADAGAPLGSTESTAQTGGPATSNGQEMSLAPIKARLNHLIEAAQAKLGSGLPAQYEVIKAEFDGDYYLHCHADIARGGIDPIKHYIEHGAREGRNPSPEFHTKYYVDRYPDVKESGVNPFYHWLTVGRAEGRGATPFSAGDPTFDEMCRILGRAPKDVEQDLIARKRDLRKRFENGVLGEMVAKAAELDPLIAHSWREALQVKLPPFHSEPVVKQIVATHRLHEAAEFRRAKAVVVIPHCRLSGATRIAGHLANALAEIYGADELVVVRTDLDVMQFPEWFPAGCRHISFADIAEGLAPQQRWQLFTEFLRALRPAAAFNVNSRLFWDVLAPYGKALSASMALYAYFFCNDKNVYGHWEGYPVRKFYRHFDVLSGVITDSHFLADELHERFLVPPNQAHKITTLETPITEAPAPASAPEASGGRRPQIFWSGRFDRQKRVDIAFAVAERVPEADFRLWGEPVLDNGFKKLKKPDNVILEGIYRKLSDVPLHECDLWFYTSEWDGVPNILVEMAAAGVPLVGSLAGGTDEILKEEFSSPVKDIEDIDAYVAAIRKTLAEPDAARVRAARLREQVLARRTTTAYRRVLEDFLAATAPKAEPEA